MNIIPTEIKQKLTNSLLLSSELLSKENINIIHMTDKLGIKAVIKSIIDFKEFNFIKLINLSLKIKNNDPLIKTALKIDNATICAHILTHSNPFIINDIANQYFGKNNSFKKASYLNLNTELFTNNNQCINKNNYYINPFNQRIVNIQPPNEKIPNSLATISSVIIRNKLNTDIDKITLNMSETLIDKEHLLLKKIMPSISHKIETEFSLYHELAHLTSNQLFLIGNESDAQFINNKKEQHSDIIAIIKIVKENDFDLITSNLLCDALIDARIGKYNVPYEMSQSKDFVGPITHSTHYSIIAFKSILNNHFDLIKKTSDHELSPFVKIIIDTTNDNLFLKEFMYPLIGKSTKEREYLFNKHLKKNCSIIKIVNENNQKFTLNDDPIEILKDNFLKNDYIALDFILKLKAGNSPSYIKDLVIKSSNHLSNRFIENYQKYKKEYLNKDLKLSAFFDSKEFILKNVELSKKLKNNIK